MPVDYSKWDALELSDDSDIEVHPNVDKRSFIRAKQAQIHQTRAQRKHQITTLKYEKIVNDGLLSRIARLLTVLKNHRADTATNPDELVLQSLFESALGAGEDKPPPPPEGVHGNTEQPVYSQMMASLVDQVKKELDQKKPDNRLEGFITGVEGHKTKVEGLNRDLLIKLAELEKEDARYITSDSIHTGFDVSHVNKKESQPEPSKTTEVELLNPSSASMGSISSGAEADVEDDDDMEASPEAKEFSRIPSGDYYGLLHFIQKNPSIVSQKQSDGLLVEAFNAEIAGKETYARQCVHQGLLLQYCDKLGKDGVPMFFKRITQGGHQANEMFKSDVASTYQRIRTRAKEIKKQREEEGEPEGVETIQLHAVDPNTTINIQIPRPIPTDLTATSDQPPPTEEEIEARKVFESFPPGLQRALESRSLDAVNKVLAKMSVDEAEEVVEKLSNGGMLAIEEGVVDATTDEGKKIMEEINRTGHLPGGKEQVVTLQDDPPVD